ncbi:MAG: DNA-processing protein DprA [Saprospiraceae bacterium]
MGSSALLYRIALTRVPNVGPITSRTLISYCGGAEAVFQASVRELCKIPGINQVTARAIQQPEPLREAERELTFTDRHDIRVISYLDPDYPARLRNYPAAPTLFYYRGEADLNAVRTIAVVGTRQMKDYGARHTQRIIAELQPYAPLVISGLAFGVDGAAHRQCLAQNLPTLGVMGSGMQHIYPAAHRDLARRMVEAGGGLLTEYPSWSSPDREHFPARNRIVAMLSDAIVVIQTARKGGSIITAQMGNEYKKIVFALPGRADDSLSDGCNWLIKTDRARLIQSAEDIVHHLKWQQTTDEPKQARLFADLSLPEQAVIDLLPMEAGQGVSVDEMSYRLQTDANQLASLLLQMECKDLIRALPGNRYGLA